MKKFVLVLAGFALTGFYAIASDVSLGFSSLLFNEQSGVNQGRDGFTEINLDQLPEAVKKAAEKDQPGIPVVVAEEKVMASGEKIYRVMYKSREKGLFTKTFHADGREYKEEKKE